MFKRKNLVRFVFLVIAAFIAYFLWPLNGREMRGVAISEFGYYVKKNRFRLKKTEFQGPYLDLTNEDRYIYRWYKLSETDSVMISVYVSPYFWEEPFITEKDSSWELPSL